MNVIKIQNKQGNILSDSLNMGRDSCGYGIMMAILSLVPLKSIEKKHPRESSVLG